MQRRTGAARGAWVMAACVAALVLIVAASLVLGVRAIDPAQVWLALTSPDPADADHNVVLQLRVPRTVVGLLAGTALGLAGMLIQGVTRNPIADPGLLGVNAGASLAVVLSISFLGVTSPFGYIWFAFAGAAVAAVLVFAIGRSQPVRLALVGAALTALLTPLIALVLLRDTEAFNQYRFWAVGSLTGRDLSTVAALWPFVVVGAVRRPPARAPAEPARPRRRRRERTRPARRHHARDLGRRDSCCCAARRRRSPARSRSWGSSCPTPPGGSSAATTGGSP